MLDCMLTRYTRTGSRSRTSNHDVLGGVGNPVRARLIIMAPLENSHESEENKNPRALRIGGRFAVLPRRYQTGQGRPTAGVIDLAHIGFWQRAR